MASSEIDFSQEIVFVVSLLLLSFMFYFVTKDIARDKFQLILFTLIALFLYRATP